MEKKIGDISDAFEHYKFAEALSIIEQTLKKSTKQDKKKEPLHDKYLKIILCFRIGALASLGRVHEADIYYEQLTQKQNIEFMGNENPFLVASISQLFGQNREKQAILLFEKYFPTFNNSNMHRFYLSTRMFASLSKIFLKEFMANKNNLYQLGQVFLEYLQNIDKANMIEYKRDGWYKFNPNLKASLKLVSMFLDKSLKNAEDSKVNLQIEVKQKLKDKDLQQNTKKLMNNDKIIKHGTELKLKIAINEGRVNDAIKLYYLVRDHLKFPFTFIRSIIKLKEFSEQKQVIEQFYLSEFQRIFRINLDFQRYTPAYDYYNQFLTYLKGESEKQTSNLKDVVKLGEQTLKQEQLYDFSNKSITQVFNRYYNSIYSEYTYLIDTQNPNYQNNKNSDYYKICLKGLLLQIIEITNYLEQPHLTSKYLKEYTAYFQNTLTYNQQIRKYWSIIYNQKIIEQPSQVKNDNQLIQEINFTKIELAASMKIVNSYQQTEKVFQKFISLYRLRAKQVELNRKLQKGQRYISDEFLTILCDFIRAYLQNQEILERREKTIARIVNQMQYCVEVSPYNADIKLRLIYFLSILNHYERLIQVLITNDIKSVQMETLGYLYLKPVLEFGLFDQYQHFLERMIKSYHENQRETSEYALKALKAGELDRVEEYLCYRNTIMNSYNSVIILFALFLKYRFQTNSQSLLLKINDKLNKFKSGEMQLTFNSDFKVFKNQIFSQYTFGEFYGLYNNFNLLQNETQVYLHEQAIVYSVLERNNEKIVSGITKLDTLEQTIASFEIGSVYDFSEYNVQEEKLIYNLQHSRTTLQKSSCDLNVFKLISLIRISAIRLATALTYAIKSKQSNSEQLTQFQTKVIAKISELTHFYSKIDYRDQIRLIVSIRRGLFESYSLINLLRETFTKNKKLKSLKGVIEQNTSSVLELLYHTLIELRWGQNKQISNSKIIQNRDESLQRQLKIEVKQVKRIIDKYQNINRT